MFKKISILCSLLCILAFALPARALDMQPGEYEITSKVEMPGMPSSAPPQTVKQCITKQDPVPSQAAAGSGECDVKNIETKGNTVTWDTICDQHGQKVKSTGKMTYHGDSFEGTMTTQMGPEAGNMTITTKVSGKRIGPCK